VSFILNTSVCYLYLKHTCLCPLSLTHLFVTFISNTPVCYLYHKHTCLFPLPHVFVTFILKARYRYLYLTHTMYITSVLNIPVCYLYLKLKQQSTTCRSRTHDFDSTSLCSYFLMLRVIAKEKQIPML
jgi:hypothetical protein